jgi:post-segregation antitoxin (ccd killing protein)
MQIYLPDDLYEAVKKGRLPASELLQEAVRAELRRRELVAESERYTAELEKRVGQPTARQRAQATALARRIAARRAERKAG